MQEYALTLSYSTPHEFKDYETKLEQIRNVGHIELLVKHTGESRGPHYHGIILLPNDYKYSQLYDKGQLKMNVEIKRIIDKYGWIKYCYHEQHVYKDFVKQSCQSACRTAKGTNSNVKLILNNFNKVTQPTKQNKQSLAYILNLKIFK